MNSLRTLLLLVALLSGCRFYTTTVPVADYYYLNPHKNLYATGRVAIVELENNSSQPQISADITQALFQALQQKQIFSLFTVQQNDPAWRSLQLNPDSTCTPEQLLEIRNTLKCDGVLIGTIMHYRPYPHMAVGLRLKLVDLRDGQLLWALEQIWDSADKTTESRIENYFHNRMSSDLAPLHQQLVGMSSLKFIRFVAYEVGETLRVHPQKHKYYVWSVSSITD